MLDVSFYSSPIYAQPMVEASAMQIENMVELYREKNPTFNGEIVIIGHGISSLILFDILSNQKTSTNESRKAEVKPAEPQSVSEAGVSNISGGDINSITGSVNILSLQIRKCTIVPNVEVSTGAGVYKR